MSSQVYLVTRKLRPQTILDTKEFIGPSSCSTFLGRAVCKAHQTSWWRVCLWAENLRCDKVIAQCLDRRFTGPRFSFTINEVNNQDPRQRINLYKGHLNPCISNELLCLTVPLILRLFQNPAPLISVICVQIFTVHMGTLYSWTLLIFFPSFVRSLECISWHISWSYGIKSVILYACGGKCGFWTFLSSLFMRRQLLLLLWWTGSCARHYKYPRNLESFNCYDFASQHCKGRKKMFFMRILMCWKAYTESFKSF